jgi:hypothetical protein
MLSSGMSYRVMVQPDYANEMTLPALRKLRELISAGAIVVARDRLVRRAWPSTATSRSFSRSSTKFGARSTGSQ